MKSIMAQLVMHGRMHTTVARAKEVRPRLEHLVTIGRRGRVSDLRILQARLSREAADKLFYEIAPQYRERKGGYLRIVKEAARRKRDGTPLARIEFVALRS